MEWSIAGNGTSAASSGVSRVSLTYTPATIYRSSKCFVSFSSFCQPHVRGSKLECSIRAIPFEPHTQLIAKPKRGRPRKKNQQTETQEKYPQSQALGKIPAKDSISKKRGRPKKSSLIPGDNAQKSENAPPFQDISDKEDEDEVDEGWPNDEDIPERWRVRASDFFMEPRIRNEIAEDGSVIDWEGESNKGTIQEISCLEWENTVFHPSPLIVLLFERYTRASANWKVLKELEKAIQVYWDSNKLPPRTVKVDAKVEKDLASALRVKDIPQLLFIRGGKLLYRETEIRTADEYVKMIAHFYYNAKRPPFLEVEAVIGGKA